MATKLLFPIALTLLLGSSFAAEGEGVSPAERSCELKVKGYHCYRRRCAEPAIKDTIEKKTLENTTLEACRSAADDLRAAYLQTTEPKLVFNHVTFVYRDASEVIRGKLENPSRCPKCDMRAR